MKILRRVQRCFHHEGHEGIEDKKTLRVLRVINIKVFKLIT